MTSNSRYISDEPEGFYDNNDDEFDNEPNVNNVDNQIVEEIADEPAGFYDINDDESLGLPDGDATVHDPNDPKTNFKERRQRHVRYDDGSEEIVSDEIIVDSIPKLGEYLMRSLLDYFKELNDIFQMRKNAYMNQFNSLLGKVRGLEEQVDEYFDNWDYHEFDINDVLPKLLSINNTKTYMQKQRLLTGRDFVPDALEYYINCVVKFDEDVDFEFMSYLESLGIDYNYIDKNYENVLYKAIKTQNPDLIEYLLEKEDFDLAQTNIYGCNILHASAIIRDIEIIQMIVEKLKKEDLEKMIIAVTKGEKQTPLHYVAKEGSAEIAEYYINELKADKEAKDFKDRTPLFLAAEYNRKSIVKKLIDLECAVCFQDEEKTKILCNKTGQTALYWIVKKMPDIAPDAMESLLEPNHFLRKNKIYLAPLEPKVINTDRNVTLQNSLLSAVVESFNLELVVNPIVACLIEVKWNKFGRSSAWIQFILTALYVFVWVSFSVWVPYNVRYKYDLTVTIDQWRLVLFILGILFTVYLIISEILKIFFEVKYQHKSNKQREKELDEEIRVSILGAKRFVREEKDLISRSHAFKIIGDRLMEFWTLYDWCTIILLVLVISTHLDDILSHSENKAKLNNRILSVAIIMVSLRLLKAGRVIMPKFGVLVTVLVYSLYDILVFFLVYVVVWLSFSVSFWIIWGGAQFSIDSNQDLYCFDVNNLTSSNCTVEHAAGFETFDVTAYYIYRFAFGGSIDEVTMPLIDNVMMNPLIALYIALVPLILVNIFIALLSNTFERVYNEARSYTMFQRAEGIINIEKSMSFEERVYQIKFINEKANPYIQSQYNEPLSKTEEKILSLGKDIKEQKKTLADLSGTLDSMSKELTQQKKRILTLTEGIQFIMEKNNVSTGPRDTKNGNSNDGDIKELKQILFNFLDAQSKIVYDQNRDNNRGGRNSEFDYLQVPDIDTFADIDEGDEDNK